MMKSACFMLALGLVCSSAANATTIVIRRTPEYIVVGADSVWTHDSIVTDQNGKRHPKHVVSHECKINQFHDIFFTHAGYAGPTVIPLAKQAAIEGATMAEKAAIYNRLIKTGLEIEMEQIREQLPDAYRRVIGTTGSAFEAAFFGMDHGRPIVAIVVYQIANLPDQRVALQHQDRDAGCAVVVSTGPRLE